MSSSATYRCAHAPGNNFCADPPFPVFVDCPSASHYPPSLVLHLSQICRCISWLLYHIFLFFLSINSKSSLFPAHAYVTTLNCYQSALLKCTFLCINIHIL